MLTYLVLGFSVATLGSMLGAGGGFILVPILIFALPHSSHENITALSLFTVALNATSGSIAYSRQNKIHFKAGLLFAAVSLPGAALGVALSRHLDRQRFEMIFAIALLAYAAYLLLRKKKTETHSKITAQSKLSRRQLRLGSAISIAVSTVASFLGIGGGIIHVPLMATLLRFPVHLAAGTSHFILAVTSVLSTVIHVHHRTIDVFSATAAGLGIGAIAGAQIGARLSKKINGDHLLKILAVTLAFVALRLLFTKV